MSNDFTVKDSGARQQFDSGMVRDTTEGKTLWALIAAGPMLKRWAVHLTKGAVKYGPNNWLKAAGDAEYQRFRESAFRHFMQWFGGDTDEDHAAAVIFNVNGAEYVKEKKIVPTAEDQLQAMYLLADHAYESGAEIGELIDDRRRAAIAGVVHKPR